MFNRKGREEDRTRMSAEKIRIHLRPQSSCLFVTFVFEKNFVETR